MPTKSTLLFDAFDLDSADELALERSLAVRYQSAYQEAIQAQLDRLIDVRLPSRPATGRELRDLQNLAGRDAASIIDTYNRELQNKIEQLRRQFPDAPLDTYQRELVAWREERKTWKDQQIERATRSNAYDYATRLFIERNNLTDTRVIWYAVPPIVVNSHPTCIERVGRGAVPANEAKDWQPPHPNCRHRKQVLLQTVGNVPGDVWRG